MKEIWSGKVRKERAAGASVGLVTGRSARRRGLRALLRERRSAVALELAVAAVPFFLMLLGSMEVSYDLYVQAALNLAVNEASRAIWTGQAQGQLASAAFVSSYICPNVSGLLDCSLILVTGHPITSADYYSYMQGNNLPYYVTGSGPSATIAPTFGSGATVCTGGGNAAILFQAVYVGPVFTGTFFPNWVVSYNGGLVHPTYAANAFVNQNFGAAAACT